MNEDQFNLYNMVLVRHGGELGVKSRKTRSRMINILNDTIRVKTKDLKVDSVVHKYTRSLVTGDNINPIEVADFIVKNISGVDSTSPVQFLQTTNYEEMLNTGVNYALTFLESGDSFGFKVRRTGNHDFSSMEVAKTLGDMVSNKLKEKAIKNISINLTDPKYFFHLEIKYDYCFYFHQIFPGINGLPRGSQGYILASIRPWSPDYLAACMMQRRGASLKPIFFRTGISDQISKSHTYFQNFISTKDNREAFNIDLEENFLKLWVDKLSKSELCQACHIFTENCSKYIYNYLKKYLGIVNGTSFKDISPEYLKELDSTPNIPVHRPNLLSLENNVPPSFKFMLEEAKGNDSCCTIQENREYCKKNELSPELLTVIEEQARNTIKSLISLKP
ncbi:MAG: THUMP domain-containing protein [Candidatus Hodarchaeales archaeon]|jgi:adenylyl- and sulfurtransferase ThiI